MLLQGAGQAVRHCFRECVMHLLYPIAKRFIAGEDLQTAAKAIRKLIRAGFFVSVDILGENVHDRAQAEAARDAYLELLRRADDLSPSLDISVKLSLLGLDIDPELCKTHLEELLRQAVPHTVRLDMEGSPHTQATLDRVTETHAHFSNLGQALQAYLFRSEKDLESLMAQNISVRLCKGAYKEPSSIAYQSMDDIRANFLRLARRLLKQGHQPAIATHDEHLLKELLAFIEQEKIPAENFYFEMLYGVARDLQKQLRDRGYRVRVYVPYGQAWLPYTLRRLAEKKENVLFVAKNIFKEALGLRKLG